MGKDDEGKKPRRDISGFVDPFVVTEPKRFRIDEWATASKGGIDKAKGEKSSM